MPVPAFLLAWARTFTGVTTTAHMCTHLIILILIISEVHYKLVDQNKETPTRPRSFLLCLSTSKEEGEALKSTLSCGPEKCIVLNYVKCAGLVSSAFIDILSGPGGIDRLSDANSDTITIETERVHRRHSLIFLKKGPC